MPQHKLWHFEIILLFAALITATVFIAVDTAVVCISAFVGIRVKFTQRELHFAEDRAGIVIVAGLGVLFGQAEVARGKHELNFTFHSDDRKYTDSDINVIRADTVYEITVEARAYTVGNGVYAHTAMSEGLAAFNELAVKTDGRCNLNHHGRKSGLAVTTQIAFVEAEAVVFGVGSEHRNVLFAAEKDNFFIECAQTFNLLHSAAAKTSFKRYAEIIAYRYLVKALIEGYGLDVDVGIDDFDAFASYRTCFIDNFLTAVTQVNAHILQTILVARRIKYFINADTAKLFLAVSAKSAERTGSFVH